MGTELVSTGTIIKMYMEENSITVVNLAKELGISLRTIVRVINDERPLDAKIAIGINKLIPEIKADFLLSYDAKYQLQKKLVEKENGDIDISIVNSKYCMKKLYKEMAGDELALFKKAKQIFGIENILNNCNVNTEDLSFCFSVAKGEKENRHLIWLKTAYYECKEKNNNLLQFDKKIFVNSFSSIKEKTFTSDIKTTLYNIKSFCKKCGINFYFRPSIPRSRVKAVAVKDREGFVYIFISDLFRCIENLWLAFIHECIHILNDDFEKIKDIKNHKSEIEIDENYIDEEAIAFFVGTDYQSDVFNSVDSIINLAKKTKTPISIAMEIARFKTKKYQDSKINKYIHYY